MYHRYAYPEIHDVSRRHGLAGRLVAGRGTVVQNGLKLKASRSRNPPLAQLDRATAF